MRINAGFTSAIAASGAGASRPRPGAAFQVAGDRPAPAATGASTLASLDVILALQGEGDRRDRRRRHAGRGQALLDGLDGLKAALLIGRVGSPDLRRLEDGLAGLAGSSGDPGLDDVVAAIALRVQVELAKLDVAYGRRSPSA